ncbi:hypothetical protein [Rhabdochlamydiaceae symbiont of Dictyostelium giganteum]|uniref:hypothetical protein n=1 Tax=Rhabdochlamydiaceae symbiont of Dictyostelium giganteum TaxID=3342349 RepID=UPI00384EBF79
MTVSATSSALPKNTLLELPPFTAFELDFRGGASSLQYRWKRDPSFIYTVFKNSMKTAPLFGSLVIGAGGVILASAKFILGRLDHQPLAIKNKIYTDLKKQGHILWNQAQHSISFQNSPYLKGALIGAGVAVIGSFALKMLYEICYPIQVSLAKQHGVPKSDQESAKARAILNLFLDDKIEAFDWECSHSHEIMAFPVKANCGHVFDFFALSLMMQKNSSSSLRDLHPCSRCDTPIHQMSHEQSTVKLITENAHVIFNTIEQLLANSHLIDGLKADEIKASIEKGQTFTNHPIETLAGYLAGNESLLSREERFAFIAYVLSQFIPFHNKIRYVYSLSSFIIKEKISPKNAEVIQKPLQDWYEKREFIPQHCTLTRKFYNAL